MESCKNGIKKLKNPTYTLEALINFYAQSDLRNMVRHYESKLKDIPMADLKIGTNDHELITGFTPVIRRYLHFGERNDELQTVFREF